MAVATYAELSGLMGLLQAGKKAGASYVWIENMSRLALGADPMKPSHSIDLSTEKIEPYRNGAATTAATPASMQTHELQSESPINRRRTGTYWVEVLGKRMEAWSYRDVLSAGLIAIEEARPGTLEKLSHIKPKSRRIVARDPKLLFDKAHLVKDYSQQLVDGWWFGTNNSGNETNKWLERACSCAGLTWEKDCSTNLPGSLESLL